MSCNFLYLLELTSQHIFSSPCKRHAQRSCRCAWKKRKKRNPPIKCCSCCPITPRGSRTRQLGRARPRGPDSRTGHERAEPMRSWSLRRGRTGFGWYLKVMERCLSGKPEHTRCVHTRIVWHHLAPLFKQIKLNPLSLCGRLIIM